MSTLERFQLKDKVAIITGGAGLLGRMHAESIIEAGGIAILLDISKEALNNAKKMMSEKYNDKCTVKGYVVDITKREQIESISKMVLDKYKHIDILINNAANNPKVEGNAKNMKAIQFGNFPIEMWNDDIAVGLTGAFLCAQVFGWEIRHCR